MLETAMWSVFSSLNFIIIEFRFFFSLLEAFGDGVYLSMWFFV